MNIKHKKLKLFLNQQLKMTSYQISFFVGLNFLSNVISIPFKKHGTQTQQIVLSELSERNKQ